MRKPAQEDAHQINDKIRAKEVRLVGDNVEPGVYPTSEALKMAEEQELDLVVISDKAEPFICRILDYKKFLYEQKKKQKELKAKQVKVVIKEIRFGPQTDEHDFQFKKKHAEKFLEEGSKLKTYVFFKGRSIVFKDQGEILLLKLAQELEHVGKVDQMPKLEGKRMKLYSIIFWILNNEWKDDLEKIFWENNNFDYPKPVRFIKFILDSLESTNSIILDFFAWSGTTGHAVLELNKEDWWNRQFILCSNRENTTENPEKNICRDITYERNKRVIQGYTNAKWEQVEGLGGNLRYYKTTFINKNPSIDDLRYSFIHKCDDLLCIKENTFTKIPLGEDIPTLRAFGRKNLFTVILYDINLFETLKEKLRLFGSNEHISLYLFTMSHPEIFMDELRAIHSNIDLKNIPDDILETYLKIFNA